MSEKNKLARLEKMRAFIRSYWTEHHFSPDSQEIRTALGGISTSMVDFYRGHLEREGWLETQSRPRLPRSFVPAEIFANRPVFLDGTHPPLIAFTPGSTPLEFGGIQTVLVDPNDGLDDRHAPMIRYEKE